MRSSGSSIGPYFGVLKYRPLGCLRYGRGLYEGSLFQGPALRGPCKYPEIRDQAVWETLSGDPNLRSEFADGRVEYLRNMDDCTSGVLENIFFHLLVTKIPKEHQNLFFLLGSQVRYRHIHILLGSPGSEVLADDV